MMAKTGFEGVGKGYAAIGRLVVMDWSLIWHLQLLGICLLGGRGYAMR
jgi:hypothetical protein